MQEAGFMNFLRTILFILLIYYGLKLIMRIALPFIMNRFAKNVERKFQQQQDQFNNRNTQSKVGETTIDRRPEQKSGDVDMGEYVDFEEVD